MHYMRHFVVNPIPGTSAQMQVYLHDPSYEYVAHSSRPCVVIFPGGSYRFTADREAEPVALAFLHAGFQVCILRYSTRPNDKLPFLGDTPMREGAVALHYIRANAASWCIDPEKVSVCGFSAGGHAAGCTGVFWNTPHIPCNDRDSRPDAMLLCYAVSSSGAFAHRESFFNLTGKLDICIENDAYSLEKHITPSTPPTFLWHTFQDSAVPVENALLLASALHAVGIPSELHAYGQGEHGLALCNSETGICDTHAATWFSLAVSWLERIGLGPN